MHRFCIVGVPGGLFASLLNLPYVFEACRLAITEPSASVGWKTATRFPPLAPHSQTTRTTPFIRPNAGVAQGDARQDAERGAAGQGRPVVTCPRSGAGVRAVWLRSSQTRMTGRVFFCLIFFAARQRKVRRRARRNLPVGPRKARRLKLQIMKPKDKSIARKRAPTGAVHNLSVRAEEGVVSETPVHEAKRQKHRPQAGSYRRRAQSLGRGKKSAASKRRSETPQAASHHRPIYHRNATPSPAL